MNIIAMLLTWYYQSSQRPKATASTSRRPPAAVGINPAGTWKRR
jgi:hypothetical protein